MTSGGCWASSFGRFSALNRKACKILNLDLHFYPVIETSQPRHCLVTARLSDLCTALSVAMDVFEDCIFQDVLFHYVEIWSNLLDHLDTIDLWQLFMELSKSSNLHINKPRTLKALSESLTRGIQRISHTMLRKRTDDFAILLQDCLDKNGYHLINVSQNKKFWNWFENKCMTVFSKTPYLLVGLRIITSTTIENPCVCCRYAMLFVSCLGNTLKTKLFTRRGTYVLCASDNDDGSVGQAAWGFSTEIPENESIKNGDVP